MPSQWYPGQNAQGYKPIPEPTIFLQTPVFQKSISTANPPSITTPGTAGPGTAVLNNTGYDCMVYVNSGVQGISGISTSQGSITSGTVFASQYVPVYVPAGQSITVTYASTGTVTWKWLAI